MLKKIIKNTLKFLSYDIRKIHKQNNLTFKNEDQKYFENIFEICEKESLNVSKERFLSLFQAVNYIYKNNINGDLVECGVFRGGSAMMIAFSIEKFKKENEEDKNIWLYDTYQGMANVSEFDINIINERASEQLKNKKKLNNNKDIWAYSHIDYVKKNMERTGYNNKNIIYIEGLVEETLKEKYPETISLLRLDTDFYESTKIELEVLYPRVQVGGIIIIDDYGHWKGCKKAVDEYFVNKKNVFFQQIDYSGIIGVKTSN